MIPIGQCNCRVFSGGNFEGEKKVACYDRWEAGGVGNDVDVTLPSAAAFTLHDRGVSGAMSPVSCLEEKNQ